jgi:hypothetical protein
MILMTGYFRGQFTYTENKVEMGSGPAKIDLVGASINFFTGRLVYRWNLSLYKERNPRLWLTNRICIGKMYIIKRFDFLTENKADVLEFIYEISHHRESRLIKFNLVEIVNQHANRLPVSFILFKSLNHILDPYTNVKMTMESY